MIHLYTVTARRPDPLDRPGIDGAPLRHHACGPLYATVSEHPRAPATGAHNATAHAEVVAAVAERVPAVPIRFGVDHADVVSLREALAAAEDTLLETLERVGDAVEFVVRPTSTPARPARVTIPHDSAEDRGRTYLEDRLRERRNAREARERVADDLSAATAPLEQHAIETNDHVGRAGAERCFLVRRRQTADFREAAREVLAGRDDLLLGGPWPPYTFVGDGAAP